MRFYLLSILNYNDDSKVWWLGWSRNKVVVGEPVAGLIKFITNIIFFKSNIKCLYTFYNIQFIW